MRRPTAGLFEVAHRGTLFLDEIGELPLVTQTILLRAVGEGEIVPLGDTYTRQVDVRPIAASARELLSLVESERFVETYHRLRLLHVRLPSLRERASAIH